MPNLTLFEQKSVRVPEDLNVLRPEFCSLFAAQVAPWVFGRFILHCAAKGRTIEFNERTQEFIAKEADPH